MSSLKNDNKYFEKIQMNFVFILIVIVALLELFSTLEIGIRKTFAVLAVIVGIMLIICGIIYDIYTVIELKVFSFSVFDTFKYLKMYGKECLISCALFYVGVVFVKIGQHIDSE